MEPAFIGSDSKVSSGTIPEDVGEMEVEGRVHSVFEQEDGMLADALMEPDRADEAKTEVLIESIDEALDAGSCVLARRVDPGADAEGTALLPGGAGELICGAACELAGGGGAWEDGGGGEGAAPVLGGSTGASVFGGGGGASVLGGSLGSSVLGGSLGLSVFLGGFFAATSIWNSSSTSLA